MFPADPRTEGAALEKLTFVPDCTAGILPSHNAQVSFWGAAFRGFPLRCMVQWEAEGKFSGAPRGPLHGTLHELVLHGLLVHVLLDAHGGVVREDGLRAVAPLEERPVTLVVHVEREGDHALEVLHEAVEPTALDAQEQVRVVREETEGVDAHAVLLRGLLERARHHEARIRVRPHQERIADALERDVDEILIRREVSTAGHDGPACRRTSPRVASAPAPPTTGMGEVVTARVL